MEQSQKAQKTVTLYREKPWDWVVASLCISFGVAGLKLANDTNLWNRLMGWGWGSRTGAVFVGSVLHEEGGVRFRPGESPVWRDLRKNEQKVAGGDVIFTSDDGKAELKMADGGTAKILPNSLIVIQADSDAMRHEPWFKRFVTPFIDSKTVRTRLNLRNGSVKLRLGKEGVTNILAQDKMYELKAPPGSDDAAIEVSVDTDAKDSDPVKFTPLSSTRVEVREATQQGSIDSTKSLPLRLLLPPSGETLVLPEPISVSFSWRWIEGVASRAEPLKLEIQNRNTTNEHQVLDVPSHETMIVAQLKSGSYQWRLSSPSFTTFWSPFTVVSLQAPQVVGPPNDSVLEWTGQKKVVLFTWQPLHASLRTEVEVAPESDPNQRTEVAGTGESASLELDAGSYLWWVRAVEKDGHYSPWSSAQRFSIRAAKSAPVAEAEKPKPKPKPEKPAIEILPTLEMKSGSASTRLGKDSSLYEVSILLQWKALPGIKEYTVTVLNKDGSTFIEKRVPSSKMNLVIKELNDTNYRYRVSATVASGKAVSSSLVPIHIELASPVPKKPLSGAFVPMNSAIVMTWEKTALTVQYHLQIAADSKFSRVLLDRKESNNLYLFKVKQKGTFYWRIKSLNAKRQSAWSAASVFKVRQQ